MTSKITVEKQRQRAPSKRSLATRERILDAAEQLFSQRGFDGASMRDIATLAGVQVGLVHHHGGGKESLFHLTVARRADELSNLRIAALEARKASGHLSLHDVVGCFIEPYITLAQTGGPQWLAYARLVAWVSADPRWKDLAATCFDPTAGRFVVEIAALYPAADPQKIATGFVYSVAAMLAQLTSAWRIEALGDGGTATALDPALLVRFCAAGIEAAIT